ncbi:hypothetical protein [Salmonella enterica]|uniref:hypothetical protein n=1 Tax=Salmonella enterica TaxID=28901 RepID=UPI0017883FB9|nr:hypothetical protein [Salmonella enterica]MBE1232331.1 hypothetical protein [Salmonella enterica subsp. enterica serovar Kottbus]
MTDLMADGGIFLILFFGVIFAVISTAILAIFVIKCIAFSALIGDSKEWYSEM